MDIVLLKIYFFELINERSDRISYFIRFYIIFIRMIFKNLDYVFNDRIEWFSGDFELNKCNYWIGIIMNHCFHFGNAD
jgi:hypothetical protein